MADGAPPILQQPLSAQAPPAHQTQPAMPPVQPAAPSIQPGPLPQLNWSHFKPEFAGKPDEDAEIHLLWMYNYTSGGCQSPNILFNFSRRS